MGFMDAKFSTQALLNVSGVVTAKSYNNAVRALKNVKTDMLCKPWYVGNLAYHIPNNTDITVDYKAGAVVLKEKCFDIAPVDQATHADPARGRRSTTSTPASRKRRNNQAHDDQGAQRHR